MAGQIADHAAAINANQQSINSINSTLTSQGDRLSTAETSLANALQNITTLQNTSSQHTSDIEKNAADIQDLADAIRGGSTGSSAAGLGHMFKYTNGEVTSGYITQSQLVNYLHSCVNNASIDQITVNEYAWMQVGTNPDGYVQVASYTGWEYLGVNNAAETNPVGINTTGTVGTGGTQAVSGQTGAGAMSSATHTHAYAFADNGDLLEDGSGTVTATYTTDGKKVTSVSIGSEHPHTGELTTGSRSGKLPFPARADHRHGLNVVENVLGGGLNPADYIEKSGLTASFGTQNFYARIDHVHPLGTAGTNPTAITPSNGMLLDGTTGRLTTTWNNGEGKGFTFFAITRIVRGADYSRRLFVRKITVGSQGNIVSVGPEEGYSDIFSSYA